MRDFNQAFEDLSRNTEKPLLTDTFFNRETD